MNEEKIREVAVELIELSNGDTTDYSGFTDRSNRIWEILRSVGIKSDHALHQWSTHAVHYGCYNLDDLELIIDNINEEINAH